MEIDKELYKEIKEYCDLNGIKPKEYANNLLRKAFMEDKYGKTPFKRLTPEMVEESKKKVSEVVVTTFVPEEKIEGEIREILKTDELLEVVKNKQDENKSKKRTITPNK